MDHLYYSPRPYLTYDSCSMSPEPFYGMDPSVYCMPTHTLSATKPVKKRKSWGQELPEPSTNLPPRKRAKTDDEKEQRRIERIKRNRAAAHNSRERKRKEAEDLAVANDSLMTMIRELQTRVARQDAQLAICKEQLGSSFPTIDATEEDDFSFDRRFSETSSSLSPAASSSVDQRASISCSTPATSPETTPYIKSEDNMSHPLESAFNADRIEHEATIGSVNTPDFGLNQTFAVPSTHDGYEFAREQSSCLVEPFVTNTTEAGVDTLETYFDFDGSSTDVIDYANTEPLAQLADFGAALFARDGSVQAGY